MSAFEIYLRTGRRVHASPDDVEVKFNHWHDPKDGRFTFANLGRYFGTSPGPNQAKRPSNQSMFGGGSFGGGGAGGSWGPPKGKRPENFRGGGGSFGGSGAGGSWDRSPKRSLGAFGGGSSGGGGAGGSWDIPAKAPSTLPPENKPKPIAVRAAAHSDARLSKVKNGYRFDIDSHVRPVRISGEIYLKAVTIEIGPGAGRWT